MELLYSVNGLDDEPTGDEADNDPLETIRELVDKAMKMAGITPDHYRFHETLTGSQEKRPLLKVCGDGCHPDLEKVLEPLLAHVEIAIFPDHVRFMPMKG